MIFLTYGNIQDVTGLPIVPFGYIEMYLTGNATIIAPPYGQVLGGTTNFVRFFFDGSCNLIGTPQIWSNSELNPQNSEGLGTAYITNFYDQDGTRLNNGAMIFVFPNTIGETVDLGTMVSLNAARTYYPIPLQLYPVPVDYVLIGPASGANALPTWRLIQTTFPSFADDEVPSGTINGTNPTFTLANTPNPVTSLNLFQNGIRCTEGIAYLLVANTITYQSGYIPQPASGGIPADSHISNYRY